ncbi:type I-F CRISPR-associated endoribonuclease Cas6/Csy4 [Spirochaeta africana]|uniref:CRISPR-associated protein Cas6/Csy4, subtype I-F/YPEST n=1 Tax=Spirochaeta africana (strain ATCC 700263 / DSM 8902 / Z-7692) TaxID=889378 RepID=H9UG70_SPIAZ|nr:type I-F CRISPR-associated endoribonuclease Cas6/Csy4 [Spirochaeta africana]AFG36513.1 CRISPR-associated protein Cas6/Csy4, subtype I-F/YPEST [Spirochaeta africana DSM 8902]
MNYYSEITLLPGADIGLYQLWSKVFTQVHLRLVEFQNPDGNVPIGVDWPEYKADIPSLGTKLRIFSSTRETLEQFDLNVVLLRFSDYVKVSGIRSVPQNISSYVAYERVQKKQNPDRIARRRARRSNLDYTEALRAVAEKNAPVITLPYVQLISLSTKRKYSLFLAKRLTEEPGGNISFNSFGINKHSTVPSF